ncbi:type II CRISPR-associated endonuclease Cas1 [Companilactobacillus mindensis]|uniref:type II CRISPR-associated endonuclease Cas1 n=1 Tax=Companilactobacillus mindensis TaxID=167481 RepID=UPI00070BBA6E|nr:type II CRISPR-associated endonuclease Cas1 [Companilactobacillus mindensis]GEO78599.1 CRISPR-associated endonuclease Cas1 [Companilactobacillus mindensis]
MGWETIYITQKSKLSYKANHLLIQTTMDIKQVPFHQINCIVVATTQSVITGYLISKLIEENIKVIFCSEDHNPCAELNGYYNNINRNQNMENQISWSIPNKQKLWTNVVNNKINNQLAVLKKYNLDTTEIESEQLAMVDNDETNREAVIARKYFPLLFGANFTRGDDSKINAMLDYGYTILLSAFNQEIVAQGYLTQLGIHHHSVRNDFNLSSDLMEPFRQFVDLTIMDKLDYDFDEYIKLELVDVLNQEISYDNKTYILKNAVSQYIHDCFSFMDEKRDRIGNVGMKDEE